MSATNDNIKELPILIVDDLPENIIAVSAVLKNEGYKTLSAKSGQEALDLIETAYPGLILMDVQMPGMNGFEVLEKLKQHPSKSDIPVIFLTAYAHHPELQLQGLKAGGLDFLIKPIDTELLLIKVANFLTLSKTKKQLKEANARLVQKARQSEDTFENFFYTSPDEIFILNENGIIVRTNRTGILSMGIYANELIGKSIRNLPFSLNYIEGVHPDHLEQNKHQNKNNGSTEKVFEAIMMNGVKGKLVLAELKTDKITKFYEISGSIFHTASLERFLQLNVRDVSRRIEFKQQLEESEEKYKAVVDTQSELICRWDFTHGITFVNKAFCRFFHLPEEKLMGFIRSSLYVEEDLIKIRSVLKKISPANPVISYEVRMKIPGTGEERWVSFNNRGFFNEKGKLTGCQSVGTDITERKKNELELRIKSAGISGAGNPIGFTDLEGKLTFVNHAFCKLFGYSESELIGKHTSELWENKAPSAERYKKLRNEEDVFAETTALRKNGEKIFVTITANVIKDNNGNVLCYMGSLSDITEKKKAETALKQSEARLKEAQRIAGMGNWQIERVSGNIFWSEEVYHIFEIDIKQKASYEAYKNLIHPDDRKKVEDKFEKSLKSKLSYRLKYRLLLQNGKVKYVVESCENSFDENGNNISSHGTLQDVTDEEKLYHEIEEKSKQLNEAQRIAKLGSWELDIVEDKLYWSDEVYHIFEINKENFKATYLGFLDKIHPDDRDRVNEAYTISLATKKPYKIVHRLLLGDQRIKYVEERCETIYNAAGNPVKSIGTILDISEKVMSEEKIRISEERFDLAMQGANDGLWDFDVQSGDVYFSPRYLSMLGFDEKELKEKKTFWEKLLHPDDKEKAVKFLDDFIAQKIPEYNQEFRMKHKAGHYVDVLSRGIALRNRDGKIYRMVGTHSDVTEKNRIMVRLKESELFAKGILDSLTSHIAVVDVNGWILETNNAWNEFSITNGENNLIKTGDGSNYFAACRNAYENGDDIAGKVLAGISKVLAKTQKSFQIEYPCHSAVEERWFLLTVTPYHGEVSKVVVRHINITEKRKTDQKMKLDSEILSGISDAVIYSDLDLHVIEWNSNAEELFGWSKAEMLSCKFTDKLQLRFTRKRTVDSLIIDLIKSEKSKEEITVITKGNKTLIVEAYISLLKNKDGIPVGIVSVLRDISEVIEYENSLRLSELNYKELFEQSPFAVITLDLQGTIQSVNRKTAEMTGFSKYKLIGKQFHKSPFHILPFDFKTDELPKRILQVENEEQVFEALIHSEDHKIIHCELSTRRIKEIGKISVIMKDISSVKNSEKFNRTLHNLLSYANSASVNLFNFCAFLQKELSLYFSTENFCVSNFNHHSDELEFIYFNDDNGKRKIAPPPRKNINGLTEFVIKNAKPILLTDEVLQNFYTDHAIVTTGNKAKCWMGVPLIADSQSVGAIAVQSYHNKFEYTTENMAILERISIVVAPIIEKLKNDRKLLLINSAVESAGDAFFITNPFAEGNPVIFANAKFFALTGYTEDEFYGNNISKIFGTKTSKKSINEIENVFKENTSFHDEVIYFPKKYNSGFWCDLTLNPIKNKDGATINFVGIMKDITLKKEMEKMLIEKNKELELFMYRASHDLKGPLSTTKGLLNFAIDECRDNNMLHYLQMMRQSNEKLENILSDLMEIVIIREGVVEKTETDMNKLIQDVISESELRVGKLEEISIVTNVEINEKIKLDVKLMKIILRNVISNAVKYTFNSSTHPYVMVNAATNGNELLIEVSDNGIGINERHINKVFDMFYRATDVSTGTGLGLYITKNAIDKLKGEIALLSREKHGTTVTMIIPI